MKSEDCWLLVCCVGIAYLSQRPIACSCLFLLLTALMAIVAKLRPLSKKNLWKTCLILCNTQLTNCHNCKQCHLWQVWRLLKFWTVNFEGWNAGLVGAGWGFCIILIKNIFETACYTSIAKHILAFFKFFTTIFICSSSLYFSLFKSNSLRKLQRPFTA